MWNEAYLNQSGCHLVWNVCERAIPMYTNEPGAAVTLPAPHHILMAHFNLFHLQGFFYWEKGATALWIWPVVSDNGLDFNRLKPPKAVGHRKTCNYSPGLTSFESKLAAAYARQIAMSHMFVCSISKTPKSIEYSVITWLNEFPLPGFTMGCSVMGMY